MDYREFFILMTDIGILNPRQKLIKRCVTFSVPSEWLREWMEYEEIDDAQDRVERLMCDAMSEGVIRWEEVD